MQNLRKGIKKIMGLLAVVSLLIIFNDVAINLVDKIAVPLTSRVKPENSIVLIFTPIFVIAAYLTNGLLIYKKNYVKHPEHSFYFTGITLIFYTLFRFNNHYVFYGIGKVTYIDAAVITAVIMETLSYFLPFNSNRGLKKDNNVDGLVSDNPSKTDKLGRADYAELLLNKICATYKSGALADGSMTILLNERYGAGKTTFLNLLENKAKGRIRTCVFKPWQTSDGSRITEELLRLLEEQYAISNQLRKQLEGYSMLLSGGEVKNVFGFASHLLKDRDSLARRYESIKEMLQIIDDPLVVMVDDVDRLQAEELLELLKLLRNTADFPNILYLVAADKESMSQMLEVKGIKDADEYLKKFFNFELLFPIDDSYMGSLLRESLVNILSTFGVSYSMTSIDKDFLSAQYIQNIFHSPRDVYRFINLLTYTLDLFKRFEVLEDVYAPDLVKLMLIQFISPMVYKILRDETDLLLEVRGYDGRIHLKEGYKDIIISRQYRKQLQEVISQAKQKMNGNDADAIEVDPMTLFDIPVQERPNKEGVVSDLLRDLFYDTHNYQEKSRICYLGEYFKFFAGKYSKRELSSQYMKELMGLQSEATFEETMNLAVEQRKVEFLVHKLIQYIEDATIEKDIPFVLKRCIIIQDEVYRDWSQKQTIAKYPKDYCQIGQFRLIYSDLLLVDKKDVVTSAQEIERVKKIYATNKQYAWLAFSLTLPISEDCDMSFIYGQELHLQLRECLIRRFIAEELNESPFELEKIKAIPLLKDMSHVCWEEQFKEFVRNYPEPKAWLYILLKPSGDMLVWNYVYYHNLVGEGTLDSYAKESLGLDLSQEISSDLAQIYGMHNEAALTAANFDQHPFLVEAKKWWDAKEKK